MFVMNYWKKQKTNKQNKTKNQKNIQFIHAHTEAQIVLTCKHTSDTFTLTHREKCTQKNICACAHTCKKHIDRETHTDKDTQSVTVIVVRSGIGDLSSNPERGWLYFTLY